MKIAILRVLISASILFSLNSSAEDPSSKTKLTAEGRTLIEIGKKIPPVNTVNVMGVGNLVIRQSDDQKLDIEGEDKVLPMVEVSVKDSALFIQLKESQVDEDTKIKYLLSIKDIDTINTFGNASVSMPKTFVTKSITLGLHSSGDCELRLEVDKFSAAITGGAKVTAMGKAAEQTVDIKGAGMFNGTQLIGNSMKVSINGAGVAYTNTAQQLGIEISGVAEVKYCQKPTITKNITGTGNVMPLPENECRF